MTEIQSDPIQEVGFPPQLKIQSCLSFKSGLESGRGPELARQPVLQWLMSLSTASDSWSLRDSLAPLSAFVSSELCPLTSKLSRVASITTARLSKWDIVS